MRVISLKLALHTALLVAFSVAVHAQDKATVSQPELRAKIDYCKTCYGFEGQGYRGFYPMPRLAGQQGEYIENQLHAFIERRRQNPVMFNVAHVLNPAMVKGLAAYFGSLNPKPLGGGPKELVAAGKKIYEEGVPASDIPPCGSCHGPEAKGDGVFPRLAGQLNDYIMRKLTNWDKERGQDPKNPDTSAIMEPIAHNLTEQQIDAVAVYLSYLE
jgi:cytochrome c553